MKKGFTLLEILLVIAAIGILAAIVIVAINPNRQLAQVRDAERKSSVNTLSNALGQYLIDNGEYPVDIQGTELDVCNTGGLSSTDPLGGIDCTGRLDLRGLVPDYIAAIPQEPGASGDSAGYKVFTNNSNTSVYVKPSEYEAQSCPDGYVRVPGNPLYSTSDFCVMKYEAKDLAGDAVSQPSGDPWVNISQSDAETECANVGAQLITNAQWMTIAKNLSGVNANWNSGEVGNGVLWRGHSDNSPSNLLPASADDTDSYSGTGDTSPSTQRRTHVLSNGDVVWDISGNVYEWTTSALLAEDKPSRSGDLGVDDVAWREFTDIVDFSTTLGYDEVRPGNSSYSSTQNIGRYIKGDGNNGQTYGVLRGGDWDGGANVGIYTFNVFELSTHVDSDVGFRCVIES